MRPLAAPRRPLSTCSKYQNGLGLLPSTYSLYQAALIWPIAPSRPRCAPSAAQSSASPLAPPTPKLPLLLPLVTSLASIIPSSSARPRGFSRLEDERGSTRQPPLTPPCPRVPPPRSPPPPVSPGAKLPSRRSLRGACVQRGTWGVHASVGAV